MYWNCPAFFCHLILYLINLSPYPCTDSPVAASSYINVAPNFSPTLKVSAIPPPRPQSRSKQVKPIWEVPQTKRLPSLKSFQLTKELVEQRVQDNIIIMTFGNYAFMDFILNWVRRLTDLGLSNILVGKLSSGKSNLVDSTHYPSKCHSKSNLKSDLQLFYRCSGHQAGEGFILERSSCLWYG